MGALTHGFNWLGLIGRSLAKITLWSYMIKGGPMTARVLETALVTSATGTLKSNCKTCDRRFMCQRISSVVEDLRHQEIHVWDIEHRLRFRALVKELAALGFDYPDGITRCDISQMHRPEIMALLREAQELLIEVVSTP